MAAYPALFEPDHEKGGFTVTFPDVPGCVTQGDDLEEASEMAVDALAMMLSHIVGQGGEIPRPSARRGRKFRQIQLPPMESAKLELYRAFRASGLRKAELARRLGIRTTDLDLLFDLERPSRFERIEAAFRALGKRLVISVEEAA